MEQGVLLCVDDEIIVLTALKDQLRRAFGSSFLIEIAESAEEALDLLDELAEQGHTLLVIVSDWLMPGMKGDEFLIHAHQRFPSVVKIMLSGQAETQAVDRAAGRLHCTTSWPSPGMRTSWSSPSTRG